MESRFLTSWKILKEKICHWKKSTTQKTLQVTVKLFKFVTGHIFRKLTFLKGLLGQLFSVGRGGGGNKLTSVLIASKKVYNINLLLWTFKTSYVLCFLHSAIICKNTVNSSIFVGAPFWSIFLNYESTSYSLNLNIKANSRNRQ